MPIEKAFREMNSEVDRKLARLRAWMAQRGFQQFFLYRPENFAWLTAGGDSTVVTGEGVASLAVTPNELTLRTSRVETRRLADEELEALGRPPVGISLAACPWYEPSPTEEPSDLSHDLTPLRIVMEPEERRRFAELGREAAEALTDALKGARPDWTEGRCAGAVAGALYDRNIQPVVLLVAGEDRLFKYRHPLPKSDPLGKIAMAVACGRRSGLVANLTRIVSFGYRDVQSRYAKVLGVEARALEASRPGSSLGGIFQVIRQAYEEVGEPRAIEEHHQGGLAGYRPREVIATPDVALSLDQGMVVAWNPSLLGTKVEDTFLITQSKPQNLTVDPRWPTVEWEGRARPGILELG